MTFPSVASFKTNQGTADNELCQILGYAKPGDGGGGVFYWSTTCDKEPDGGIVFKVDNVDPGRWIRNIDGNIINVKWFGAFGNGIDCTAQLQHAVDAANAYAVPSDSSYFGNKPTLYFPIGDRYLLSNTLTIDAGVNVNMEAPIAFNDATDTLPGMIIGSNDVNNAAVKLQLRISKTSMSNWANESCVGVKLVNLLSSDVTLEYISSFTINVLFYGSQGCAYNRVNIGTLQDAKVQLELQAATNAGVTDPLKGGFCNENVFTAGRFTVRSSKPTDELSTKSRYGVRISLVGITNHLPDNNVFYKPSFELSATNLVGDAECRAVVIERGVNNRFWDARNEDSGICSLKIVGADCRQNSLYIGYSNLPAAQVNDADDQIEDASSSRNNRVANYPNYYNDTIQNQSCWQSPFIPKYVNKYNATDYFFRGLHCANMANGDKLPARLVAAVAESYVEISGNTGIGVFVNTEMVKKFIVRRNFVSGFSGRVFIVCYNSSKAIIPPVLNENLFSTQLNSINATQFGGCYSSTTDTEYATTFTVADNVAFVRVILAGGTASLRIRSFSIGTLDYKQITAYTGLDEIGIDPNLSYAAVIPTETKPKGTIIYNDWSQTTTQLGWRSTGAGR
ncbi:hypothetical protein, partial [Chitinophaga sp.]|uniref:hypothetical protein n=1 Tax=Chitinophaga sp. TaxID=1869181 RepID=UPI002F95B227